MNFDENNAPNEVKLESESVTGNGATTPSKKYSVLKVLPTIVFTIFAILTVLFAFLPVARVDAFGLNEKYGSIFTAKRFDEIAGLKLLSTVILIVTIVTAIFAVLLLIHKFTSMKYRSAFNKPLYKLFELIAVIFVFAFLVLAFIVIGQINSADGGVGIIKVSLYPVLTVILSGISLVVILISIALCNSYEKAHPEILQKWSEERQALKANDKSSTTKKVSGFASKKFIKILAPLIVILLVSFVGTKLVARFENIVPFEANSLKQIAVTDAGNFSATKYTVEAKVGKSFVPKGATEDSKNIVYYTDNYIELYEKLERNQKYLLLAVETGDSRISSLLRQAKTLQTEYETLAYGNAKITFGDTGYLQEIVYNNVVIEGLSVPKKLDSVKIYKVTEKDSLQENRKQVEKLAYLATYADGSFIYRTADSVAVVLDDGTTSTDYEGSYAGKKLTWTDEFGKYEVIA